MSSSKNQNQSHDHKRGDRNHDEDDDERDEGTAEASDAAAVTFSRGLDVAFGVSHRWFSCSSAPSNILEKPRP